MGWDTDAEEVRAGLTVLAAMAVAGELTPEHTATVAEQLGVTPTEVVDAYTPEMRRLAMEEIMEQPAMAELDKALDDIARES
ncbi:hypothetical protein [Streptomyces sp. URMC 129]|uniref:hypothetical protein n=1 Tax=Streptomyces sp. URMC 129 TaxID=3423407 RepID=UPI003F1D6FAB